jgi:hypothetical protein
MGLSKMVPGVLLKTHDLMFIKPGSLVRGEFGNMELY